MAVTGFLKLTKDDQIAQFITINREAGYTIGFFMFWLATASSSLFTWILLRPASRFNKPLSKDPQ